MAATLPGRDGFDLFKWKRQDCRVIEIVLRDPKTGKDIAKAASCNTGPFDKKSTEYQLQTKVKEAFQHWLGPEGLV